MTALLEGGKLFGQTLEVSDPPPFTLASPYYSEPGRLTHYVRYKFSHTIDRDGEVVSVYEPDNPHVMEVQALSGRD